MTNEAVQAFVAEFGNRICILIFDNGYRVYIGYDSSGIKSVDELLFQTFGGVDMIGIVKKLNDPVLTRKGAKCVMWHATACLQDIAVIDEGFANYRIDPMDIG